MYLRSKKVRPYVETTPVRSSLYDLVSATKLCEFYEIKHWKFFYKMLLGKLGLREIRRNDRHTILKDVNSFLPLFPYFLADMGEIRFRRSPRDAV